MFLVTMGAAAGEHTGTPVWAPVGLMIAGIFVLALLSASRASQVGLSPGTIFIATLFACALVPFVLGLIAYLAAKKETTAAAANPMAWVSWVALLVVPWAVLFAIRAVVAR
jgi:hypothetical protein